MTMLTERDKKLLYLLAVVAVLAAVVYLLLFPALRSYSELNEQAALATEQVAERQAMIGSLDQTNSEVQQLRRQIAQKMMRFPAIMHNLQLDRSYTQRAVLGGWQPTELVLGERGLFELVPFDGVARNDAEKTEEAEKLGMLPSQLVSMKAVARQSDIFALMQLYAESPHEKLESFTIKDDITELSANANSDDPLLSVEYSIRQVFGVEQPAAVQESGASFE